MTFDANDPRLTAYALGELDDADRAEVETLLAGSAEARSFVEETRATAQLLTEHLHREPSPGLAPEHHRAIEQTLQTQSRVDSQPIAIAIAAPSPAPAPARRWRRPGRVVRVAVAAGIVGVLGILLVPAAREQLLPEAEQAHACPGHCRAVLRADRRERAGPLQLRRRGEIERE